MTAENVSTLIIFRTTDEILGSINTRLKNAPSGISQMTSNVLSRQAAKME